MVSNQQSTGRGLMTAAAVAVLFGGVYLASSILGFVMLAVFFALLCHPIRVWLMGRGLASSVALTIIAIGLAAIVAGLALLVGVSLGEIVARLNVYQDQIASQSQAFRDRLGKLGLSFADRAAQAALNAEALGRILAGIIASIAGFLASSFYVLLLVIFLLVEGPAMFDRASRALGSTNPLITRFRSVSPFIVRYFGLRTYLNAMTGVGFALALLALGVDYALLWGALMFFLSYVPYVGIFVASIPPTILALAEHGPGRAILVVAGITVINIVLENIIFPRMVGKGLNLPATVVFLSFFVWLGLLGAPGALLSVFLTLLILLALDSYEHTRWLAKTLIPEPSGEETADKP
ncbi:MAG: AI-2E family transporter [Oscillochloridaceae bacterium]|nr:AI-2E family transporter [Chloroflexaceae bacterium]MDW8391030.1 AI-2E family transporter [Oscillochloridaceae bacterium]